MLFKGCQIKRQQSNPMNFHIQCQLNSSIIIILDQEIHNKIRKKIVYKLISIKFTEKVKLFLKKKVNKCQNDH